MLASGQEIKDGTTIEGLGVVNPDPKTHNIITDNMTPITNETVTPEELGGASVHTTRSSIADGAYANDIEALTEIRRLLGVSGKGDYVAFVVDDGEVRLARRGSVVAETAGAVTVDGPPLTAEEEREVAEIAIAEDVIQRMGR